MASVKELCKCFTKWLSFRKKFFKERRKDVCKTGKFTWYNPEEKESPNKFSKTRFDVNECEQTYLKTLQGDSLVGDMAAARFQYSAIKSCERAFLLRHTTVPVLLAHGYIENAVETNGLYDKYMTDHASNYINVAKEQLKAKEG